MNTDLIALQGLDSMESIVSSTIVRPSNYLPLLKEHSLDRSLPRVQLNQLLVSLLDRFGLTLIEIPLYQYPFVVSGSQCYEVVPGERQIDQTTKSNLKLKGLAQNMFSRSISFLRIKQIKTSNALQISHKHRSYLWLMVFLSMWWNDWPARHMIKLQIYQARLKFHEGYLSSILLFMFQP
jgi:hypothetical protein